MKPEAALVTALAAGDVGGVRVAADAGPEWERIAGLAVREQVDGLCWWMWRNAVEPAGGQASSGLSDRLRDRLRQRYLQHLLRNEALLNDLAVLAASLAAHDVGALFLKGPWMVMRAYPDPGTRPVGDVDVCVREDDYPAAVAALADAGWAAPGPLPRTPSEALEWSHYRGQLRFGARGRRPVELHFRLINLGPPGPPEGWLWDTARELRAGPVVLRIPGPEAMLLHLLLHANQHGFSPLRLLHDVRWACERDRSQLDAARLLELVRELRCGASCHHALRLADELAGAAVPETILGPLRPSRPRRVLFARIWRLASVRRLEAGRRSRRVESPLFYLLEMGRLRDKARFVIRMIAAPGRWRQLLAKLRLRRGPRARGSTPRPERSR